MSTPKDEGPKTMISLRVSQLDKESLEQRAIAAAKAGYYKTRSTKGFNLSKYILWVLFSEQEQ